MKPSQSDLDTFNKKINSALKVQCEANSLNLVSTAIAECGPPDLPGTYLLVGWVYQPMSQRGGQFKSRFILKDGQFDPGGIGPMVDKVMETAREYFYSDAPKIMTLN